MPCIYKITSPTERVYIGQTWNFKKRLNNYKNLYCKTQTYLYRSFLKYGFDNHRIEIIHSLPEDCTQEIIDDYEKFYLNQYKSCKFKMMNLREGGARGKHSEESKRKMSDVWNRPVPTAEVKNKIKQSLKKYYSINKSLSRKKVIQSDRNGNFIKLWNSAREAAKELNINYKGISQIINGHRPTYKGFIWKVF